MLWEHLPERFRQVRTCLVNGTENPASVKLSTPIPSDPFAIGSAVHRPEYWTVFSNMDGPQSSFVVQHRNGILHHQFILARFAEAQVFTQCDGKVRTSEHSI